MAKKDTGISLKTYDISSPERMAAMAKVLKDYVVKNKLYSAIKGKNYVHVEGWQFAGGLMGLVPMVIEIENLSAGTEFKWKATTEIVNVKTGLIVGRGFALCSSKEGSKKSFDEYAVLSMAQTRSIGKAYRNLVGWVMKLSGYEGTPSEEMHKVGETQKDPPFHSEPVITIPQDYSCSRKGCGEEISKQVFDYSKKVYGKPLCRADQKDATPLATKK